MLATKRIAKIVRQLLDTGRSAGGDVATILPCDPGLAIGRAMARLRQTFGKGFAIDANVGSDTRAGADVAILEQVLYNLLQNAVHAIRVRGTAGRISLSTRRSGQRVLIEVADNGDGIPTDLQHRLFEPFFTTKEFGQGSGLGLAVSLGLMRAQQGDLKLVRSDSTGSVFELELTWSPDDTSSLHIPSAVVAYGNLRLLIVDDDRQIRDGLRRALGKMFRIEVAASVEEAIECISKSKDELDAVLCDILMPNGGGARVYSELCQMAPRLAQRTLFMTGGATSAEAQDFLKAHAERVMLKPLNQTQLREAILALVRAKVDESP
jgi:CheY-like chemotaxis protein